MASSKSVHTYCVKTSLFQGSLVVIFWILIEIQSKKKSKPISTPMEENANDFNNNNNNKLNWIQNTLVQRKCNVNMAFAFVSDIHFVEGQSLLIVPHRAEVFVC